MSANPVGKILLVTLVIGFLAICVRGLTGCGGPPVAPTTDAAWPLFHSDGSGPCPGCYVEPKGNLPGYCDPMCVFANYPDAGTK